MEEKYLKLTNEEILDFYEVLNYRLTITDGDEWLEIQNTISYIRIEILRRMKNGK